MALNIHLTFEGNCREAFEFYRSVFGIEFAEFQSYADGPPEMSETEGAADLVMHVALPMGSSVLMGADWSPHAGAPLVTGNNFSIAIEGRSREHCDTVFGRLSEGGAVTMPLQETFWGAYFGSCTDRFGVNWMINFHLTEG